MQKDLSKYLEYKLYIFVFYFGLVALLLFIGSTVLAEDPNMGTDNIIVQIMCNVIRTISGPVAQGIATLVIVITGYSFFMGKVSASMLFIVAGGIMLVFGAETLMSWIMGDTALVECEWGSVDGSGSGGTA
ncbi:TrbC/VirB2 family protein [Anaplasmataceae bacterium AB001_6]|nr:TrbC/VirB2 family protein [Anaplasmataceae bacterium AB001_6]